MKLHCWKRICGFLLTAAVCLSALQTPVWAADGAEEEKDLLTFSGEIFSMATDYAPPVLLEAGETPGEFDTARLVVKAPGALDPLDAVAWVDGYDDLHVLQFDDPASAEAALAAYSGMEGVIWAEPDRIVTLDPEPAAGDGAELAETEDHLSWGYGEDFLDADTYNDYVLQTAGGGSVSKLPRITVAVIDTGVRASHEFLRGRVLSNGYDFVNDDRDPDDDKSHGTHVAGTVADGTLSNVKILPVKVLNASGSGTSVNVALGIRYAADHDADVMNLSLGGTGYSYVEKEAVNYAVDRGVSIVVSAGNNNSNIDGKSLACYENVVTVAAAGQEYEGYDQENNKSLYVPMRANFSSFGDGVDVTAPGVDIESSVPPELNWDSLYEWMSGTSMASPHVAAAAAMLLTRHQDYSPDMVKAALKRACTIEVLPNLNAGNETITVPNLLYMPALMELDGAGAEMTLSRSAAACCPGQTFRLTANVSGAVWSSSAPAVASVDSAGNVTCKAAGTALVTASQGGRAASCAVTVQPLKVSAFFPDTLMVGGKANVLPFTGCDPAPAITWTTSDPSILAFTDPAGKPLRGDPASAPDCAVLARKAGAATLTAWWNGDAVASATVTVTDAPAEFTGQEIHITDSGSLLALADALNSGVIPDSGEGIAVYLDADIDLGGTEWPSMNFSGTFDGQDHTVYNFRITASRSDCGFIASLEEGGVLKDLHVENATVTADDNRPGTLDGMYTGGLVASCEGVIENCSFQGTVTAVRSEYVGGICGYMKGEAQVTGCTARGTVTGGSYVGGICGYGTTVNGCTSECAVTGARLSDGRLGQYIGGICGYGRDIDSCVNSGNVRGTSSVGGICGANNSGTISGCFNYGDVSGDEDGVAGIAGYAYDMYDDTRPHIDHCYNFGTVTGGIDNERTGGICGNGSAYTIHDCANQGSVSGYGYVAGIAALGGAYNCVNRGAVENRGAMKDGDSDTCYTGGVCADAYGVYNCLNTGVVSASVGYCGGITGEVWTVENCVNLGKVVSSGGKCGDIAGYYSGGTLRNCYYTGGTLAGEIYQNKYNPLAPEECVRLTGDLRLSAPVQVLISEYDSSSGETSVVATYGTDRLLAALNYYAVKMSHESVWNDEWDYEESPERWLMGWAEKDGTLEFGGAVLVTRQGADTFAWGCPLTDSNGEEVKLASAGYVNGRMAACRLDGFTEESHFQITVDLPQSDVRLFPVSGETFRPAGTASTSN